MESMTARSMGAGIANLGRIDRGHRAPPIPFASAIQKLTHATSEGCDE
jgi:hypothetical protein